MSNEIAKAEANAKAIAERLIGVKPNIAALQFVDRKNRAIVESWLIADGLDPVSVRKAKDTSLRTAYNVFSYRESWRKNEEQKNQGKKISQLNARDFLSDDDEMPEASAKPPVQTQAPEAILSKENIRNIAENAAQNLIDAIFETKKEELKNVHVNLSETVKDVIRKLATDAAQERIDANKAPQEIVVKNIDTESSVNIGIQHFKFPDLLRAAQAKLPNGFRLNIWLTGPAGTGKTTAAENVAKALSLPFASDGSLDADYKVLGFRDAAGNVHSTEFLRVFQNGGIYCADEIDNWQPSALLSLNAALANGFISTPGGMIKRHKDFICIACANTWGLGANSEYVGRTKLDAASLDRFQPKIEWPVDEKLESAISPNEEWTLTVQTARRRAKDQGLKVLISPRATFSGAALLAAGFSHQEVIKMTIAAGLTPEQCRAIGVSQ